MGQNENLTAQPVIDRTKAAIRTLRGEQVILDADLAAIFGVETKRINEQAKRNPGKFPPEFRFQLNENEWNGLKSQFATSKRGGTRKLPYAYTEHGVLQVANVITSPLADSMSVLVIRGFVEMRNILHVQQDLETVSTKGSLPSATSNKLSHFMERIGPRLENAMQQVLDTVLDPKKGTTIREEAQNIMEESIQHLKNKLKKSGLENEEIAARITKILAEADHERAQTRKLNAESDQLEFLLIVRKLKLVLEAQKSFSPNQLSETEHRQLTTFIALLHEYSPPSPL